VDEKWKEIYRLEEKDIKEGDAEMNMRETVGITWQM